MTESITEEESDIQDTTEVREEAGSEEERIEETSE